MSKKTRKRLPVQEKAAILRLHLLEHTPISDLCDRYGIHPTMFYRWQKELFENAAAALEPRARRAGDDRDRRIAALEQKLQRKNEVLSELMEEHIKLKKELGELRTGHGFPKPLVTRSSRSSIAWPVAQGCRSGGCSEGWGTPEARSAAGDNAWVRPTCTTPRSRDH